MPALLLPERASSPRSRSTRMRESARALLSPARSLRLTLNNLVTLFIVTPTVRHRHPLERTLVAEYKPSRNFYRLCGISNESCILISKPVEEDGGGGKREYELQRFVHLPTRAWLTGLFINVIIIINDLRRFLFIFRFFM